MFDDQDNWQSVTLQIIKIGGHLLREIFLVIYLYSQTLSNKQLQQLQRRSEQPTILLVVKVSKILHTHRRMS